MYNILISGYYGFNNIGDESILRTVIDNLREKLPDIDITVLSQDPAQTSAKYGVKAARRPTTEPVLRTGRHPERASRRKRAVRVRFFRISPYL